MLQSRLIFLGNSYANTLSDESVCIKVKNVSVWVFWELHCAWFHLSHGRVCECVCVPQTCHSKTQECQHITCTGGYYTVPISHTPILACIRSLAALIWSVADGWNNKNTVVGTNTQLSALYQCTAHGYISTPMLLIDVPSADHLNQLGDRTKQLSSDKPPSRTWTPDCNVHSYFRNNAGVT